MTKKAQRPVSDKAMRPAQDKSLTNDLATLERDANIEGKSTGEHKTTICFNRGCDDYRVERKGDGPCSCKRRIALLR